jgi:hypothetical protein
MIRSTFRSMIRRAVRPLAVAALCVLPCGAQQDGASQAVGFGPGRGPLEPDSIVVKYFTPVAYDAGEMANSATSLFGETIRVSTHAPPGVARSDTFVELPHFVVLRNTIVIRDTAAAAQQIAQLLGELDQAEKKRADAAASRDAEQQHQQAALEIENQKSEIIMRGEAADTMIQIRPRYVSLDTINTALASFQRQVSFTRNGQVAWTTTNNITAVPDAQMLVLCESKERAAQLTQLVDQIDRPQPQAVVSVTLIRASDKPVDSNLPRELVDNLSALVPYGAFEPLTVGILRCSLATGRQSELSMDLGERGSATFSFVPEAFNADTGELTLSQCQFNLQLAPERAGQNETSHSFTTNLTFRSGEYVELGAVGARPIFVVLKAELVRKST